MKLSECPKGNNLEIANGEIESVSITIENHGCLDAWLMIHFDGGGCGFGGYKLGEAIPTQLFTGKDYCAYFLARCMNVVGVEKWESLKGKPIRCLHEGLGGGIVAIGNFLKDDWFCPKKEFGK